MGTPAYPRDIAGELRALRLKIDECWSAVAALGGAEGRPWDTPTVSDVSSTRWPSTTSDTFSNVQRVMGFRAHPNLHYEIRVSAPAGDAEWRITDGAGDVLLAAQSATSGFTTFSGNVAIPGSVAYYGEYEIIFQARSLIAGETTRLVTRVVYGRL